MHIIDANLPDSIGTQGTYLSKCVVDIASFMLCYVDCGGFLLYRVRTGQGESGNLKSGQGKILLHKKSGNYLLILISQEKNDFGWDIKFATS